MTARLHAAQSCLVVACAHVSLSGFSGEDLTVWVDVIRDVLPDCENGAEALVPLRVVAEDFAAAKEGRDQSDALSRLRSETRRYLALAAGARFEAWQKVATS